jgi:hypothetical protein
MISPGSARAQLRLATLGLCWLTTAPLYAAPPACVEIALPAKLPARASWKSLLSQETRSLLETGAGACAEIDVQEEDDERGALTLQVGWLGRTRRLPLALNDVPLAERPRAAALLARGLLQQLLQEESAVQPDTASPDAASASVIAVSPAPETEAGASAASAKSAARSTSTSTSTAALSTPPPPASARTTPPADKKPAPALEPLQAPASTRAYNRDDSEPAPARVRTSPWSGSAMAGSALVLVNFAALVEFELGLQRSYPKRRTRLTMALTGLIAPARDSAGTLRLGGPGLRAGADFLLVANGRRRTWFGPGFGLAELILARPNTFSTDATSVVSAGGVQRTAHTVLSIDLRATMAIALSPNSSFLIVLEAAYAVRFLEVRRDGQVLLAYAGPMLGLRVGATF